MKTFSFLAVAIISLAFYSCTSKKGLTTTSHFHYETECLGVGMDGTQTLKVWSRGRDKADAIQQAQKKAVWDVTFLGINSGSKECKAFPVIVEANADKKYEDYFNLFFTNGGDYSHYVSMENQKKTAIQIYHNKEYDLYGIVVIVNRTGLRKRYESDNIIIK